MALINGTNGNDTITPGFISAGVSGFPTAGSDNINGLGGAMTPSMAAAAMILSPEARATITS